MHFKKNRHKYYLKAHLIFVCKYRKQLLKEVILMIQFNPAFYEESDNWIFQNLRANPSARQSHLIRK